MKTVSVTAVVLSSVIALSLFAKEVGFIEEFALADDRAAVLKTLVPGTRDYFYYTCLNALNTGDDDTFTATLDAWEDRFGKENILKTFENRYMFLKYDDDPDKTLAYIKKKLNLHFNHTRRTARKDEYPTQLDPKIITLDYNIQDIRGDNNPIHYFTDKGLVYVPEDILRNKNNRRAFLRRVTVPDMPNIVSLICADLQEKDSGGFGSLAIHKMLTREQLDEVADTLPAVRDDRAFVLEYCARLAPSDAENSLLPDVRQKHLERLWSYVEELPASFNSLKAHVVYHLLDVQRKKGEYPRDLYKKYLSLPRSIPYISKTMQRQINAKIAVQLGRDFSSVSFCPPIRDDEELVRDYLTHFFLDGTKYTEYTEYIDEKYLEKLYAETMLIYNKGTAETWYGYLSPGEIRALRERVDIQFAPQNTEYFSPDEEVKLSLDIKNVESLIIKTYRVNAFNYYKDTKEEITTAIDLDGLAATLERTESYDTAPLHRVRREFNLEGMESPGVYVVEFIGNGVSSRAVVRKGQRAITQKNGAAGMEIHVWNDDRELCTNAIVWMGGQEYTAEEDGAIILPYSTSPETTQIIVQDGAVCSLHTLSHPPEEYTLEAGMYIDRESLVPGKNAQLIVRPVLKVNGEPVSPSLIEDATIVINMLGADGVSYAVAEEKCSFTELAEKIVSFRVPDRVQEYYVTCILRGKVHNVSKNEKEDIIASEEFRVNQNASNDTVYQILCWRNADGYQLQIVGKDGMPRKDIPVNLRLKQEYFTITRSQLLQTDEEGKIQLGHLPHITKVLINLFSGSFYAEWNLQEKWTSYPAELTIHAGQEYAIPTDEEVTAGKGTVLYEVRREKRVADVTDSLEINDTHINISGVPAGTYDLYIGGPERKIRLFVVEGKKVYSELVSSTRAVSQPQQRLLYIESIEKDAENIRIKVNTTSAAVRVQVIARSFLSMQDICAKLGVAGTPNPVETRFVPPLSQYIAERKLGDEYRYILEREYAKKYPGLMLERPGVLIQPWAVSETETEEEQLEEGEAYDTLDAANQLASSPGRGGKGYYAGKSAPSAIEPLYAFLQRPATLLANCRVDKDGYVTIPRSAIGTHRMLDVLVVSPVNTAYRSIALKDIAPPIRDVRHHSTLNVDSTYIQCRSVHTQPEGGKTEVNTAHGSDHYTYATVADMFALFAAKSTDATLEKFRFVTQWHTYDQSRKEELYSEFACHELNVFLYFKDKKFFTKVVQPYVSNKMDKDFIDKWLLEENLASYFSPREFADLNGMEKALLAHRMTDKQDDIVDILKNKCELHPVPPSKYVELFDTALLSSKLFADELKSEPFNLDVIDQVTLGNASAIDDDVAMYAGDMPMPMSAPAARLESASREMKEDAILADSSIKKLSVQDESLSRRAKQRKVFSRLYRAPESTKEWVETYYYQLAHLATRSDLIVENLFWYDYAAHTGLAPFLSENIILTANSFAEMMGALAVTELPFTADVSEEPAESGDVIHVTSTTPVMIFMKDITEAAAPPQPAPLMMQQHVMNNRDRYIHINGEQCEKVVTNEYVVDTPYIASIVVGNPSARKRTVSVLASIPEGAVPLKNGFYRQAIPLSIAPYSTVKTEYYYYFPSTGVATQLPAIASIEETAAAVSAYPHIPVVAEPTEVDTQSWLYVSQNGTDAEVLAYLQHRNVYRIEPRLIAFRMKDKAFYTKAIDILRNRQKYDNTLWSYSIYHKDTPAMKEFLEKSELAKEIGPHINCTLMTINPFEQYTYEHKEYKPLINARVHPLGDKTDILNDKFYTQYMACLENLSFSDVFTNDDLMEISYYLLLQGRISEAIAYFNRVDEKQLATQMQYDYFALCFALYSQNVDEASEIAQRYAEYPVPHWNRLFADARAHIAEIRGETIATAHLSEADSKVAQSMQMQRLADTAPYIAIECEDTDLSVECRNVKSCTVSIYPMDVELLFSRTPFDVKESARFSYIAPAFTRTFTLTGQTQAVEMPIPEKYQSQNVMIEATAGGATAGYVYYATDLDVRIFDVAGQLRVTHKKTGKLLPSVYVKVYSRGKNGIIQFYKDGYTDMRGRFDYASLTKPPEHEVERLAVLVLSKEYGAVTKDVPPPKQ